ncbi:MAG TPA: cell division protein ZapE [Gammaproteobacteria bacterium]|nr:cell division protein ZapE [Gammaproteobacteria bacterium]|tara:strand:+ start:908 stop:2068 length:1161 start_codon:yes stop_codon:yes gene_type:complete
MGAATNKQSSNSDASLAARDAGPKARYLNDVAASRLMPDTAQGMAIEHVEKIYQDLTSREHPRPVGLIGKILNACNPRTRTVRGLYLWGRVGRGKTYIVDSFFNCLNSDRKLRIHFHSFMLKIHGELKELPNEADPLAIIGRRWARDIRLLCLDEFHVGDITDAMILGNLLSTLFDNGVTLVATSNEAPQDLYPGGLQRERFLPAIELLEKHLEVVELVGNVDYRLRALRQAEVYYSPHTGDVNDILATRFTDIASGPGVTAATVEIDGRIIATCRHADGVVWFDFETLCGGARATRDYIEIALCYHTVVLSNVPAMDDDMTDAARRFINLIDELYDRNVKLVMSAERAPEGLYKGNRLIGAFKRTTSRLREMQSHEYLARPHLCD